MTILQNIMSLDLPFMISLEKRFPSIIGYIYSILANFLFSTTSLFIGRARHIPTFQLVYYRIISLMLILYFNNKSQKISLFTTQKRLNLLLICVGLTSSIGAPSIVRGFQLVPLSEAVVVLQTQPVFASILALLVLKESYDLLQFLSTILCTIGVLMIAKPSFLFSTEAAPEQDEVSRILGIICLLVAALVIAVQALLIKTLVKSVSSNLSAFYVGLIPSLLIMWLMLTENVITLTLDDWIIVGSVIICSYFGQILYQRCFRFGDAGKIAVMGYSQIIFGYVLDIFVVGASIDFYSTIGGLLIFCCFFVRIYQTLKQSSKTG